MIGSRLTNDRIFRSPQNPVPAFNGSVFSIL